MRWTALVELGEFPVTAQTASSAAKRARLRRPILWSVIIALFLAGAVEVFRGLGSWLVVEDPLEPADAIVVLSGSMPYRAVEAAQIYEQHLAPEVWLTRPSGPGEDLQRLGLEYTDEETYNAEVLEKLGVPADSIHVLPDEIVNTQDEVLLIADELRKTGKSRAIIVTSPPHTRRVRALWKALVGNSPHAVIRYSRADPYDAPHWWRNTRDSLAVVRETLGLLNVWAGLPIHRKAQ
jgi:uncharacterized SAM-binding protein YcdF (DUF218 family)